MPNDISLEEVESTVARMESKLLDASSGLAASLATAYRSLLPRFAKDLGSSPRDLAIAKSSALMLIQEVVRLDT
jgi:hypothetical protein